MNQISNYIVLLWTFKENSRTHRFYEKHGFHSDGSKCVSELDEALEVQ